MGAGDKIGESCEAVASTGVTQPVSGSGPNLITSLGHGNSGAGDSFSDASSVTACQCANVYDRRSYHLVLPQS